MGLDLVELTMKIEEEFAIAIPDNVAATLGALGQIRDFVLQTLTARGDEPDEADIWDLVKRVVAHQSGVAAEILRPETHLIEDLGLD